MGKVKWTRNRTNPQHRQWPVSIPYGKGKVKLYSVEDKKIKIVSIPYGKGKVMYCARNQEQKKRINSLWERLRCCPRAERLGNSTHATALREGEPQAKSNRQSATAKEDKSKRAYENRTSIPYGKGKVSLDNFRRYHYEKYQFPMGKVKGYAYGWWLLRWKVSTPYGKGKACSEHDKCSKISVSIPYGKGKVKYHITSVCRVVYQFPMGKVKIILRDVSKSILYCINSLWER